MNHSSKTNRQACETTSSYAKEGIEMTRRPNGIRRFMTLCVAAAMMALATHAQADLVTEPPGLNPCD